MSDDIKTLRRIILTWVDGRRPDRPNALAALERVEKERTDFLEMVNELDAVYGVLGTADAEGGEPAAYTVDCLLTERDALRAKLDDAIAELRSKDPNFTPIFDSYANENQRLFDEVELLRAKLEKAKEALEPFANELHVGRFMTDGLRYDYRVDAAWLRRARAVLAELSADAPVQRPQINQSVNEAPAIYAPERLDVTNYETVAKSPRISDGAVKAGLNRYCWSNPTESPFYRMRAAILTALEVMGKEATLQEPRPAINPAEWNGEGLS